MERQETISNIQHGISNIQQKKGIQKTFKAEYPTEEWNAENRIKPKTSNQNNKRKQNR
jgi:hypothetical protein